MKKPKVDLGPKLNSAMAQPQTMMTTGVRQFERLEAGRRSSTAVVDMRIPNCPWRHRDRARVCYGDLMHVHEEPIGMFGKKSHRNAALQIRADWVDELAIGASGENLGRHA